MYSVSRKNSEKAIDATIVVIAFPTANVRMRNIRSGRSGSGGTASIATNADPERSRSGEQRQRRRAAEAAVGRDRQAVDEQHDRAGRRERAREVEVAETAAHVPGRGGCAASTRAAAPLLRGR